MSSESSRKIRFYKFFLIAENGQTLVRINTQKPTTQRTKINDHQGQLSPTKRSGLPPGTLPVSVARRQSFSHLWEPRLKQIPAPKITTVTCRSLESRSLQTQIQSLSGLWCVCNIYIYIYIYYVFYMYIHIHYIYIYVNIYIYIYILFLSVI